MQQCNGVCHRNGIVFFKSPRGGSINAQGGVFCKTCGRNVLIKSLTTDKRGRPICMCCHNKVRFIPRHVERDVARIEAPVEVMVTA